MPKFTIESTDVSRDQFTAAGQDSPATITISSIYGTSGSVPVDDVVLTMKPGSSFQVKGKNGEYGDSLALNTTHLPPSEDITITIKFTGEGNGYLSYWISYSVNGVGESIEYNDLLVPRLAEEDDDDEEDFYTPPEDTSKKSPHLSIIPEYSIPILAAGSRNQISVPIKNYGKYSAEGITISVDLGTAPVQSNTLGLKYQVRVLPIQATYRIPLNLEVDAGAKEGIYTITLNYTYANENGDTFSGSDTINLKIQNDNSRPRMVLADFSYGTDPVQAGQAFTLSLDLANVGATAAKEVAISLGGLSAETLSLQDSTDSRYLPQVAGGDTSKVDFTLVAAEKAAEGNAELTVKVDYLDAQSEIVSQETKVFVPIDGTTSSGSIPKLIVDQYSVSPQTVMAGRTVTFNFSVKNTSREQAISNLKVGLTSADGIFTVKNGSNTFFVESIEPQGVYSQSLTLEVKNSAPSKAYPLEIGFEYEDAKGEARTASESISLNVEQETRLSFGPISAEPMAMAGMPLTISLQYYNLGKTTLNNLMIDVRGGSLPEGAYFAGNVESGRSDYFEDQVIFDTPGQIEAAVVFTFEDDTGAEIVKEVPFEVLVQDQADFQPDEPAFADGMGGPDSPGLGPTARLGVKIGIGVGAAALLGGIVTVAVVRKRRARRLEEDETI